LRAIRVSLKALDGMGVLKRIVPVMINDPSKALNAADKLLEYGVYAIAIRPPAVPVRGADRDHGDGRAYRGRYSRGVNAFRLRKEGFL
jgi:hypothetical protein